MSKDLCDRATAIRERYKLLESVRGSGHHDEDRNLARPEMFAAPQRNGLPRASEHLVPFYDHLEEQVHFAGPDAERAFTALQAWGKKQAKADVASMPGTDRKLILKILPRLKLTTVDGLPRLVVRLSEWNDVVHALYAEGVGLSGAPLDSEE